MMTLNALTAIPRGVYAATTTSSTILIFLALLGAVVFVVAYPVKVHPKHWVREGWHMWLFTLALCSLGGSSITRRIWPELAETVVYVVTLQVTYAVLALLVWQRVWLLFTAERHDRIMHEQRETDHE